MSHDLLSAGARTARSSVIRDLLEHAKRPDVISLAGGIPAPQLFPLDELKEATAAAIDRRGADAVQYGLTQGEEWFRAWAAEWTAPGTSPDDVVVTTGSQQALDLLGRVLVDPGDVVVTSDPDYLGALQSLRANQPTLLPVPMDADGMRTDVLEQRLAAGVRPKLCYVVSNFQNPTGVTLAEERRRHLAELAGRYGFVVAEDDPYGKIRFEGTEPEVVGPGSEWVVRLRTTSKILAPGLRVGWLAGPSWLVDAVATAKQAADLHTSTLNQAVAHELLCRPGWLGFHVEHIQSHYRARRDALVDALDRVFGPRLVFERPHGGMFLWGRFREPVDTTALLPVALDHGVAFVPGAAFAVEADLGSSIRLSYATATPDDLHEAADRLASALAAAPAAV
jgi:2-aminoadipate transaminase